MNDGTLTLDGTTVPTTDPRLAEFTERLVAQHVAEITLPQDKLHQVADRNRVNWFFGRNFHGCCQSSPTNGSIASRSSAAHLP